MNNEIRLSPQVLPAINPALSEEHESGFRRASVFPYPSRYSPQHYEELFDEKLELLLKIRSSERVTWSGKDRAPLHDMGVYPRAQQFPLPVWIATGGSPESAIRAGQLGLPVIFSIIGGMPERFAPLVQLYLKAAQQAGHDPNRDL